LRQPMQPRQRRRYQREGSARSLVEPELIVYSPGHLTVWWTDFVSATAQRCSTETLVASFGILPEYKEIWQIGVLRTFDVDRPTLRRLLGMEGIRASILRNASNQQKLSQNFAHIFGNLLWYLQTLPQHRRGVPRRGKQTD
jgi:hypothetical protein